MIYDSEAQKAFIQDCVRKYPTTYSKAIELAGAFGSSIQSGQIMSVEAQDKWLKSPKEEEDVSGA